MPLSKHHAYGTAVGALLATAACAGPTNTTAPAPSPDTPPAVHEAITGTVWISTDPSAAPGTLRIFLADGTLVMDSCGETYRLARWAPAGPRRIAWDEDGARIEADVVEATADTLLLRLHLRSETRDEPYRAASVPSVCSDHRPAAPATPGSR